MIEEALEEEVLEEEKGPSLMVEGAKRLGMRLLRGVAGELDRNVLVCPAAAATAVAVIINGAHGGTRDELTRLLVGDTEGAEGINGSCEALHEGLRGQTGEVEMTGAAGLWALRGLPLKDAFARAVKGSCATEIRRFSPADPDALDDIDEWMRERTGGGFGSTVDWLAPDMVLFMLSAAALKGRWSEPFDPRATAEGAFHAPGGARDVPFMARSGPLGHLRRDGFNAVRLPFEDGRTAMYVLVPDPGSTVGSIIEGLDPEVWGDWLQRFTEREIDLRLPRFRCSFGLELTEAMRPLGVRSAFSRIYSDLSELSPTTDDIFMGMVRQMARLDVNETGAGTGPAPSAETDDEPPSGDDPGGGGEVEVTVDRPFIVAVADDRTGAVLFMGCVVDP